MTKERIAEIRALLENATPGPWEIIRYEHGGGRIGRFGDPNKGEPRELVFDTFNEGDRELLYAAPTIIAELLAELDELRLSNSYARGVLIHAVDDTSEHGGCCGLRDVADAAVAELGQLREEVQRLTMDRGDEALGQLIDCMTAKPEREALKAELAKVQHERDEARSAAIRMFRLLEGPKTPLGPKMSQWELDNGDS